MVLLECQEGCSHGKYKIFMGFVTIIIDFHFEREYFCNWEMKQENRITYIIYAKLANFLSIYLGNFYILSDSKNEKRRK